MARKKKKKKKLKKIIMYSLLLVLIIFVLFRFNILEKNIKIPKIDKLKIVNIDSKTRPYAVMIDNVENALPHSGLDKAYIIYEIIVEGGLTRLMAVFKDTDVDEIGPIRSARHYFIDYALENDAIFVHHGHSPQALEAINRHKVNNLEGLYNPSNIFWRDESRYAPHNSYTNTEGIKRAIEDKEYRNNSNDWLLLNYSTKNIDLSNEEKAKKADKINIYFSDNVYTTFVYDNNKKTYLRYKNGKPHMDKKNFQYTAKNIIIVEGIKNYTIDSAKGRQEINNLGSGTGYYITNGYALKITWKKESVESKTIYKYEDGTEIKVNDGNTYIELQPTNKILNIIENKENSSSD